MGKKTSKTGKMKLIKREVIKNFKIAETKYTPKRKLGPGGMGPATSV